MCCDWLWVSLDSGRHKGSKHMKKRKTLVSWKQTLVALYTGHVHMRVVVSQGAFTLGLH
jgi:hypothetical protein